MAGSKHHSSSAAWRLAREQSDVIERGQLLRLGFTRHAIEHRIRIGRLHPVWPRVYAVGTPNLTQEGWWMAAVLTCGPSAVISHQSAAELWRIRKRRGGAIHVSVPESRQRKRRGIRVHRRTSVALNEITRRSGVPCTTPATTIVDVAASVTDPELERMINEADKYDLIDPDRLRDVVDGQSPRPGRGRVRRLLDRLTLVLTDSELEALFVPLARRAGLPGPEAGVMVNGFEVDFFWPHLGLVVETDGLRYHRTHAEQARDRLRDQTHTAAGLTPLRFTHHQIKYQAAYVGAILTAVARRLARSDGLDRT